MEDVVKIERIVGYDYYMDKMGRGIEEEEGAIMSGIGHRKRGLYMTWW